MKILNFTKAAAVLLFIGSLTFGQITPVGGGKGSTTTLPTFDKIKYENEIKNLVGSKVMGWQAVLMKDGEVISDKFGGKARNAADGNMDMTGSTPQDIGSLQKFITGTAMLNMMIKKSQWSPSKDKTLQQGLDTRIYTLFPKVWLDNIGPIEVRDITFRQLLQHRTGFDMQYTGERTVMGYLKGGMIPGNLDKREYANINFVLAGYLLPLYEHGQLKNDYNSATSNMVKTLADSYARDRLGPRMDEIFYERIFNKMSPKLRTSCNAPVEMKDTAAYGYFSKMDITKGDIWSQVKSSGHCAGQGGYYMSARDVANYVKHVAHTDLIVNQEARALMNQDGDKFNDRLVWGSADDDAWIRETYGMKYILWSNGIPGATGHRSVIIRLPQNYYLVIVTNSSDVSAGGLFNAGVSAFKKGMGQ
jgi:CubicO group peptidase (beta-lactamase class C family)